MKSGGQKYVLSPTTLVQYKLTFYKERGPVNNKSKQFVVMFELKVQPLHTRMSLIRIMNDKKKTKELSLVKTILFKVIVNFIFKVWVVSFQ